MNSIKTFTIYREYFKLINTLKPVEKRDKFIGKIMDFYFKDIPIELEVDSDEEAIWDNISRPIIQYKKNALNGSKGGRPKTKIITENETQTITENKTQVITEMESTSNDVIVNVNSNMLNVNNLENKGVIGGKETFKVASDGSLLQETTKKVLKKLNELAGTDFKYWSKSTQAKIQARLNEGYKLDDFMVVIEKKVIDWKDSEMAKFLRPETLFGNKFEGYLNERCRPITTKDIAKNIDFDDFFGGK